MKGMFIQMGHFIWDFTVHQSTCLEVSIVNKGLKISGKNIAVHGLYRLEKYLNIQDCLEKSLKVKFVLESA